MQHSYVVMGLVPMTPEMWLEVEPTPHRCLEQLSEVRQSPRGKHGVVLLLLWPWPSDILPFNSEFTSWWGQIFTLDGNMGDTV